MCAIYGYVERRGTINARILRRMGDALRHRGPDDEGEMIDNGGQVSVGLGHKRLSIIDLSAAGRQPMANEDQTIWVTFNGEIYNFKELRVELQGKGHKFKSRSDTEVIVHLYEEMGTRCVEKLDGMFAFALWDGNRRILFLGRDRIGKKPLHYAVLPHGIVFASEIKALLMHPHVGRELDLKSLSKYLSLEYCPAPDSIFKSIKKLDAGHILLYRDGEARTAKYWDLPLEDYPIADKTEAQYAEQLREILGRAVGKRLVADVPVGLFVSGGLDSGLVAALAARTGQALECFSVSLDEPSFDESPYALEVAQSLGIRRHLRVFDAQDMLRAVEKLPDILDEPLADPSVVPLYLLSQFASERMKVVLSGDGGDELFAGYQTYQAHKLVTYYDALPAFLKSTLKAMGTSLPVSHRYLSPDFKIKQFLKGVGVSSEIRFFLWRGAFSNTEKKELLRPEIQKELQNHNSYEDIFRYVRESGLTKELERILYLSTKLYLQDNNLVTVDRASMASGLEVRCPLLDSEFVDFVSRIPVEYKLRGLKTKYLLKKAAEGLLPRKIVYRQKRGFGIPLAKWLTGKLRDFMLDYLSEARIRDQGLFDYSTINRLIEEQLNMKKDNREPLWTLLVFQAWYERYIEGPRRTCSVLDP
jgi:asparagine synthase (glutamine-hydrolysing)